MAIDDDIAFLERVPPVLMGPPRERKKKA